MFRLSSCLTLVRLLVLCIHSVPTTALALELTQIGPATLSRKPHSKKVVKVFSDLFVRAAAGVVVVVRSRLVLSAALTYNGINKGGLH